MCKSMYKVVMLVSTLCVSACGEESEENSSSSSSNDKKASKPPPMEEAVCTHPPPGETLDEEGCLRAGDIAEGFSTFIGVDAEGPLCCLYSTL